MIMKKVISAMAIVGMLGTSGVVMAAANNSNQDAAANKAKAAVETSVQNQHQYKNGVQAQNEDKAEQQSSTQGMYQYQNMNGAQAQNQKGDCTQVNKQSCDGECDQTKAQDQTQQQIQAGTNNQ